MNAVIYCRVSSKEQVDGTSLESQELACKEYAAHNKINVVRVFIERGESAKYADRTQLLELMAFCSKREHGIDLLLVWKVDRLARNVGDHFNIKAGLLKYNIRVVSVTEPIDNKPEGKLLETILAGFAQFDNDVRATRTVQGMRRKIQEGIFPWKAPFGYRTVRQSGDKKTEPDEPHQPAFSLLQQGWNEYATGAYTKVQIIDLMTSRGLLTASGKKLSKQSLDNIFRDPFYTGTIRDPWSGEEYRGRHLPMVSRETFAGVQQVIGRGKHSVPHLSLCPDFPLRTFLRCMCCEHPLSGSMSRGRSKKYPYYHCFNRVCDNPTYCPPVKAHDEFISFLNKISPNLRSMERIKMWVSKMAKEQHGLMRTLSEKRTLGIKRLKEQQQQLIRMKMEQLITDEEFVAQRSVLDGQLANLGRQEPDNDEKVESTIEGIQSICQPLMKLGESWAGLPIKKQRGFQQLALPAGYVFGQIGTAQKGRLFSLISRVDTRESSWVPLEGLSWNQLAEEIIAFSAIFEK